MSQGTIYYKANAGRSEWLGDFSKELGLDVNFIDYKQQNGSYQQEFENSFPLKKTPAFINSKGFHLTETVAIITYLTELAQKNGGDSFEEKSHVLQWLSFINTDALTPYFHYKFHAHTEEDKKLDNERVSFNLKYLNEHLAQNKYLAGGAHYTSADVFGVLNITKFTLVVGDLAPYEHLSRWIEDLKVVSPSVKQQLGARAAAAAAAAK